MKRITIFSTITCLCLLLQPATAQNFVEHFNYPSGNILAGNSNPGTDSTWFGLLSTTSPVKLMVADTVLSFPGYTSTGSRCVMGTIQAGATGESNAVHFPVTSPVYLAASATSGTVYVSFLMNLSGYTSSTLRFLSLNNPASGIRAKVLVRQNGTGLRFGVGNNTTDNSNTFTATTTVYPADTTYLLVVKYMRVGNSSTASDTMKLYVFKATDGPLPTTEPSTADAVYYETTSYSKPVIDGIGIHQPSGGNNTRTLYIDNIKAGTTWNSSVLPVSLLSFSAARVAQGVLLNWKTGSESNNARFDVLHSTDAMHYAVTASLAGSSAQGAAYHYLDTKPAEGLNYYKLQQTDADGRQKQFNVVVVNYGYKQNEIKVLTIGQSLTAFCYAVAAGAAELKLYNIKGQMLYHKPVQLSKGDNDFQLSVQLQSGIYILTLAGKECVQNSKFIYP